MEKGGPLYFRVDERGRVGGNYIMKKSAAAVCIFCLAFAFFGSGCGRGGEAEVTPTPVAPTATPTPVPVTPTPIPTPTEAPKLIGVKKDTARFIVLTNSTGVDLREIYIQISGMGEWGNNLIPADSSVKAAEEVNMYYDPSQEEGTVYDVRIVTGDASSYEIYGVDLDDMERASLHLEEGSMYLRYLSLSTRNETTATASSYEETYDESYYDSSDDYYSDYSYDYSYDTEDSSDIYYDDSYYEDSYDDSYYEDSYDDSYYEDSYDESYEDDGSSGDSYEDYFDDGSSSGDGGGTVVWDENGNWTEY